MRQSPLATLSRHLPMIVQRQIKSESLHTVSELSIFIFESMKLTAHAVNIMNKTDHCITRDILSIRVIIVIAFTVSRIKNISTEVVYSYRNINCSKKF